MGFKYNNKNDFEKILEIIRVFEYNLNIGNVKKYFYL